MRLSEKELAWLIEKSGPDKSVELSFGPGHVSLNDVPSNDWAKRQLEEFRNESDGSGI